MRRIGGGEIDILRGIVGAVKPVTLWLAFGVMALIGLGMVGGGVFLLVQRDTGTRAQATVISCGPTSRYGGPGCYATWVEGGNLVTGNGHVVTGPIDGANPSDVGTTLEVTIRNGHAYTRGLRVPIILLAIGVPVAVFGILLPAVITRQQRRQPGARSAEVQQPQVAVERRNEPIEEVTRRIRALRAAGRLADAAALVDRLGPYGIADDDFDTALGAAVFAAYGDQLKASDPAAADAAYERAAGLQIAFAGGATSGGEGIARSAIADEFAARRRNAGGGRYVD